MKKNFCALPLLLLLSAFLGGWANHLSSPKPPTVGTADVLKICAKILENSDLTFKLETVASKLKSADQETRPKIEALAEQIKNKELNQEERKKLENEAQFLLGRLEGIRTQVQEEIQTIQIESFRDAYKKTMNAIQTVADNNSIHLVIREQNLESILNSPISPDSIERLVEGRPVLYRPDSMNITEKVISFLNLEITPEKP